MAPSPDSPKLLDAECLGALQEHDLDAARAAFGRLYAERAEKLELWAELLDELCQHGHTWSEWAEGWPGGEEGLPRAEYFLILGIQALQDEVFERASYYLHRAGEAAPASPVPIAYLGIMFECQGCPADALTYYRQALRLSPRLSSVHNAIGNLMHELGFYEDALSHYQEARPLLSDACNQAILLGNMGNTLRAMGRLEEAIAVYAEAIALDPAQAQMAVSLAETQLDAARPAEAIACLSALMERRAFDDCGPEITRRCFDLLARAYRERRDHAPSVLYTWLKNGGRLDEEDREGISALLKGLFRWAIALPADPVNEFMLAKLNRHLGYLDAALHHAKRAVKLQPERADHFIELGATLLLQGKAPVALEAFDEAAVLAPERADLHSFRAMALWEEDWDEAQEALHAAIRLEPNQALHWCDLAYMHQVDEDPSQTQEAFQRALLLWEQAPVIYGPHGPVTQRGCYTDVIEPFLAENANSPEAAIRLLVAANFLVLSRRRESARMALHRLLSEHPAHLDALRNYAWLLHRAGYLEEALSIWRKVLALAPHDDVSRYFALSSLSKQGPEGKAAARRELAKRLEENPRFYVGRALYAKLLEPENEALTHLEILCRQLPNVFKTWHLLGESLFHRHQFEAARQALEKAAALNLRHAPTRRLLSLCHRQLGDPVRAEIAQGAAFYLGNQLHRARAHFEAALRLAPDDEDARLGLRKVERRFERLLRPVPQDLYAVVCPRFRIF